MYRKSHSLHSHSSGRDRGTWLENYLSCPALRSMHPRVHSAEEHNVYMLVPHQFSCIIATYGEQNCPSIAAGNSAVVHGVTLTVKPYFVGCTSEYIPSRASLRSEVEVLLNDILSTANEYIWHSRYHSRGIHTVVSKDVTRICLGSSRMSGVLELLNDLVIIENFWSTLLGTPVAGTKLILWGSYVEHAVVFSKDIVHSQVG